MGYYKIIDGRKLDGKIVDQAAQCVQGAGDGRISIRDAEVLLYLVKDKNIITDIEKDTIDYIYKSFRWTVNAEDWFRKELKTWQARNGPVPISIDDLSRQHFATVDVITDPSAQADRKHALESATSETNQDHDEIALHIRLRDGTSVKVFSNFIEFENDFVQLKGGCTVPVRAIEKVEL